MDTNNVNRNETQPLSMRQVTLLPRFSLHEGVSGLTSRLSNESPRQGRGDDSPMLCGLTRRCLIVQVV